MKNNEQKVSHVKLQKEHNEEQWITCKSREVTWSYIMKNNEQQVSQVKLHYEEQWTTSKSREVTEGTWRTMNNK